MGTIPFSDRVFIGPIVIVYGSLAVTMALAYMLARWATGLSRQWALRHGIVSQVTHRSSHSIPTARLGGVGLVIGFGLPSFFYLLSIKYSIDPPNLNLPLLLWLSAGWLLVFMVGFLDDLYDLPPLLKLALLIAALLIPTACGRIVMHGFDAPWGPATGVEHSNPWPFVLNVGLSLLWLLFFINGYNFMDGMDGFAAGFARQAAIFLFLMMNFLWWRFPSAGLGLETYLLPILATACWGFLYWNNPPAKVFMGDGGSLSVGYLLAIFVIIGNAAFVGNDPPYPGAKPILFTLSGLTILLPFIFDVTLTLIRRARRGENLMKAHREHLYQRLMKTGLTHAEVLRIAKRTFWACGLLALLGALPAHPAARWLSFACALGVMLWYWRFVLARERATQFVDR